MSALVLAVPSKGRLMENAHAFFGRAGLSLVQGRGGRDYRGTIPELPGVEVAYLSAADIATSLSQGTIHIGVTGEDLIRESIPNADERIVMLEGLGFGFANVVVAVPQAWIDVRSMQDLDDVATAFHAKRGARMRVATKYVNMTRNFFAGHGIADYRIVESLGATEGAPAAGTAELIVDITTTGATLAGNGLKVIDDGVMLRSQANLVASIGANWSAEAKRIAQLLLDRIAAERRARTMREVRLRFKGADAEMLAEAKGRFGVVSPLGPPTSSGMLTLLCPPATLHDLTLFLRERGAETVIVSAPEYVFARDNPLYDKLAARLA
ncbi:MAG: ATP phosphoribosyltransferase [Xanthobacteraceae bacterium]|nr:ATP phosphoribosyltransferase [Xanthobacteraceae bacterium]QYK45498.1 MAG: ATP phosphoribosyltransferase [Xanthobacteraceae bacterium]HMN51001.1 ATP phosphoribosyltransferase [Xanthobacteraceae bacterium]